MFNAEEYLIEALTSFDNDPADSEFTTGYWNALNDMYSDMTGFNWVTTNNEFTSDGIRDKAEQDPLGQSEQVPDGKLRLVAND
jgi:hypothetical protein